MYALKMCAYFNKPYYLPFPEREMRTGNPEVEMKVMVRYRKRER